MLVEYTLGEADSPKCAGERRPAVIVKSWSERTANLLVFMDGTNDGARYVGCTLWATSRLRGDDEPYTWRPAVLEMVTTETTEDSVEVSATVTCDETDA